MWRHSATFFMTFFTPKIQPNRSWWWSHLSVLTRITRLGFKVKTRPSQRGQVQRYLAGLSHSHLVRWKSFELIGESTWWEACGPRWIKGASLLFKHQAFLTCDDCLIFPKYISWSRAFRHCTLCYSCGRVQPGFPGKFLSGCILIILHTTHFSTNMTTTLLSTLQPLILETDVYILFEVWRNIPCWLCEGRRNPWKSGHAQSLRRNRNQSGWRFDYLSPVAAVAFPMSHCGRCVAFEGLWTPMNSSVMLGLIGH
jgi:hypothetical protein